MQFPSAKAVANPAIQNREQLIQALHTASELEHMLACEYLFTAFTMRRKLSDFPTEVSKAQRQVTLERSRMWLGQILLVARQEMEHLGIVMNLLAAVGVDPYFDRPPFPQPAQLVDAPLCLDRFGVTSMRRFLWYERPAFLTPSFPAECFGCPAPPPTPSRVEAMGIHTIQELYDQIAAAFQSLPPSEVFQGKYRPAVTAAYLWLCDQYGDDHECQRGSGRGRADPD
ncbi:MAG: hypothetical protein JWN14_4799 [Chthonomonadales bacterium]|nr:hypothetical protein [Chthonomonadales bacterium]